MAGEGVKEGGHGTDRVVAGEGRGPMAGKGVNSALAVKAPGGLHSC